MKKQDTWWKVRLGQSEPEPVIIDKVDGDYIVTPNGYRHPIVGQHHTATNFFRTHSAARDFCIRRAERRVKKASAALTEAMLHLDLAREIPER